MSEVARTPAQIEAEITRRRQELAATLDELAVRVHPVTIARDSKAKAVSALDRTVGQAYVAANRALARARAEFVTEDGAPRPERIVPAALAAVAVVAVVAGLSYRRRRR
ncbi:DUF3618 domain-containing protein [Actinacidiphila sp. ITFR-21]|uniref:DUF3618 domain-containing protein n=1 Tax=Actinacidiphila sp. ITFR-21 TaxID=3075199 RepID=UPI00288BDBDB|nr:DUF3618 domain-containing protein [Streptomyces sp. ITFR-21]WNI15689.1 DUF3618 domain-containing protein [Streptomyces sp. ITFR-21]